MIKLTTLNRVRRTERTKTVHTGGSNVAKDNIPEERRKLESELPENGKIKLSGGGRGYRVTAKTIYLSGQQLYRTTMFSTTTLLGHGTFRPTTR